MLGDLVASFPNKKRPQLANLQILHVDVMPEWSSSPLSVDNTSKHIISTMIEFPKLAEWAGSAAVAKLIDVGFSRLFEAIANIPFLARKELQQPELRKELQRLKNELEQLHHSLQLAEKQHNTSNSAVESLTWELRDAVEAAEDVLDDIEYYQLKSLAQSRSANIKVATGSKRKFSWQQYLSTSNGEEISVPDKLISEAISNLIIVKTNAKSLVDILNVSKALVTADSYHYVTSQSFEIKSSHETGCMFTADKVVGRDEEKEKIVKWLLQVDTVENVSALTICGMGGLGKTTLCQDIFMDERIKKFKVKIWVSVSNQFDATKLLTKAIEFKKRCAPRTNNLSVLQKILLGIVAKKDFLLVLDDVWDDADLTSWENFIAPLKSGGKGSKILITSQLASVSKMIARVMSVKEEIHNLTHLGEEYCMELFNKHAFASVNPSDYKNLQTIGKKIMKKCGGLPLVVKHMGGLLRTRLDYYHWEKIWKNDILRLKGGVDDALEVLKLSYHHLPPNLKSCFRFCSIYLKDHQFSKNDFVHMLVGAGLIQQLVNDDRPIEEIGEEYFNSLQTRSFFDLQDLHGDKKYYVMHGLLHEISRTVSRGECLAVEDDKIDDIPNTLRHISIHVPNQTVFKHLSNLQRLRTLHIECTSMSPGLNSDLNEALKQLRSLRVLCLRDYPTTVSLDAMKHLRHLRHLNWSTQSNAIQSFPESIYTLYHLQFLSCCYLGRPQNCVVECIKSYGIGNLVNLRHLNLPNSPFKCMTSQTGEDHFRLSNLKYLNKLHRLSILELGNLTSPTEAKEADLLAKKHLLELSLMWREKLSFNVQSHEPQHDSQFNRQVSRGFQPHSYKKLQIHYDQSQHDPQLDEQVLCNLQPHSDIKRLRIWHYGGRRAPIWMTNHTTLASIVCIELIACKDLEHLPPLSQMPCLKFLHICGMPVVKQFGNDFCEGSDINCFPSLEGLKIEYMETLEDWLGADNPDWFPRLKELEIKCCNKLQILPSLPIGLRKLELDNVGLVALPNWQHLNTSDDQHVPALLQLKICSCSELVHYQTTLSRCTFLKELYFGDCPKLTASDLLDILHLNGLGSNLSWLLLQNCANISSLPSLHVFSTFSTLDEIQLHHCQNLTSLGDLHGLTSLRTLSINKCETLTSLNGLHGLTSLRRLSIFSCYELTCRGVMPPTAAVTAMYMDELPSTSGDVYSFPLQELAIDDVLLLQIAPLRHITTVQHLCIFSDSKVKCLEVTGQWLLQNCTSLMILEFDDIPYLQFIPATWNCLCSLKRIAIRNAPKLESLPDLPDSIQSLEITNCSLLTTRCQRGGPDWCKIDRIKVVDIQHQESGDHINKNIAQIVHVFKEDDLHCFEFKYHDDDQ